MIKQSLVFMFALFSVAHAYREFDRIMASYEKYEKEYDASTAEVILRQLIEMGQTIEMNKNHSYSPSLETVFFIYDRNTKDVSLIAITTHEECYLISADKTYYVEDIAKLSEMYKFVYYLANKIDLDFGTLSLYHLETAFRDGEFRENKIDF